MFRSHTVFPLIALFLASHFEANAQTPDDMRALLGDGRNQTITTEQKVAGLALFWKEADHNFAFFNHVTELDWKEAFAEYYQSVANSRTDIEYIRLMQSFAAQLQEGHTAVWMPRDMRPYFASLPPIEAKYKDGKIIVTNIAQEYADIVPIGSEILAVDAKTPEEIVSTDVFPFLSASTEQGRWERAVAGNIGMGLGLFAGSNQSNINILAMKPSGHKVTYGFTRSYLSENVNWVRPRESAVFQYKFLDNDIVYIQINSFLDESVITAFSQAWPELKSATGVIFDVRDNRGGNSDYAAEILRHFTHQTLLSAKWKSPKHIAVFRVWGMFAAQYAPFKEYEPYANNTAWHEAPPDHFHPTHDSIEIPTAVLIGSKTYSAGEDFVVMSDSIEGAKTFGRSTAGSTGQPFFFSLPGGVSAQITTKRDTFPDGTEFVGIGITPDFNIPTSHDDIITGNDPVLKAALSYIHKQLE